MPNGCDSAYLICSVQRSGTELLCTSLDDTGVAGRPPGGLFDLGLLSYDNPADFRSRVRDSIREAATPNGVSGQRMFWNGFAAFIQNARAGCDVGDATDIELLRQLLPNLRVVWLQRDDKIRQAISFWRATVGPEQWRHPSDPSDAVNRPEFDFGTVDKFVRLVSTQEECWAAWFESNEVSPTIVKYRELIHDREAVIRRVLVGLGLDADAAARVGPPRVVRQADGDTDRYAELYAAGIRDARTDAR